MRVRAAFAGLFLLALSGCDDDSPKGPGSFTVSVEWDAGSPPVGAAIVFVGGVGLGEFEAQGSALLWTHPSSGSGEGVRVVVVDPGTPTSLRFTVPVEDLGSGAPEAALLGLAGQDNALIPLSSSYRVSVF